MRILNSIYKFAARASGGMDFASQCGRMVHFGPKSKLQVREVEMKKLKPLGTALFISPTNTSKIVLHPGFVKAFATQIKSLCQLYTYISLSWNGHNS